MEISVCVIRILRKFEYQNNKEQRKFKINSVNAEWRNIQSSINYKRVNYEIEKKSNLSFFLFFNLSLIAFLANFLVGVQKLNRLADRPNDRKKPSVSPINMNFLPFQLVVLWLPKTFLYLDKDRIVYVKKNTVEIRLYH
ncbi:hypothetical protein BpHYR1_048728 [Brachionus plicatilis]|uniref:Uncharacterized protein n=1 Tax=Brachionus plicatilis TaxID=10195 RepID=A0A3M7Q872_BRAPC|nr:hypothetical protein BpHYR1_048728 [Brachionus plicatilis]